jgi:RNA 2',3'-cyclic 3'-phosphodiesterase
MPRLFTALEVPRDAAMSLSLLKGGLPGARWIDTENFHITLHFIGDVDCHTADELVHALDRVERSTFQLSLCSVGAFGGRKPHSVFAGVQQSEELSLLQSDIGRMCKRLGLDPDPRKFIPHVTLARLRNTTPEQAAHYLSGRGDFSTLPFKVGRFVLMSSKDSVGGGPYIIEEAYPLQSRSVIVPSGYGYPAALDR